jgi:outer membrane protein assembly factor BamA
MINISKYFILLIIFLFLTNKSFSQELQIYSRTDNNSEYKLSNSKSFADSISLYNYLKSIIIEHNSDGYIAAGYDSIAKDTSQNIKAFYTKGNKYTWGNLDISEIKNIKRLNIKKLHNKKDVNLYNLSSIYDKVLKYYANNGYPFATIMLDSITVEDRNINAKIKTDKGEKYYFDTIMIKGEAKIRQYYIEKYLGIKKGDIFTLEKIENIERNLKNLPFISQYRTHDLAFANTKTDIILYLENKKANNFTGILGILPNNTTTGKILLTGDINLYLLNSLGFGELFSFQWQKYETYSQTLNTKISTPYLFKTDFGIELQFNIEKKDTTYLNTDFTGKILIGNNAGNGFEAFYRNISSFILKKAKEIANNNLNDYKTNLFGIGYRFSNLSNSLNPHGIILNVNSAFGTKVYSLQENDKNIEQKPMFQNKTKLDITGFIPTGRTTTIKLRNLSAITYSKVIFDNELDLVGGLGTIRGFDDLSMPASVYSIMNCEFRYLFEEASALFAFYDIGYLEKRFTSSNTSNYAMGAGVGLDLKTQAGIFSIAYAIGKQNKSQFQFNNSKIHFGYKNYF